jgi:hypothetical protein
MSDKHSTLTQKRVRELLRYDPATGIFEWIKNHSSRARAGTRAGTVTGRGRRFISIDGKPILESRLVWLYVRGYWPSGDIDHKDGNPLNNALENLRDVDHEINMHNQRGAQKNSKIGLRGVSMHSDGKGYCAFISVKGKSIYLGRFSDPMAAHQEYLNAKKRLHEGSLHSA